MDLSFNLAPGVSMGEALQIIQATANNMRMPGDIKLNVGGDFRASSNRRAACCGWCWRDHHGLYRARHAVRKPDPSGDHSLDAAGRRRRCAAGAVDHRAPSCR
jgi:hypothetical protein